MKLVLAAIKENMTKLLPISIEGEMWIQISQLSTQHAVKLRTYIPVHYFRKITFQGIELNDCLQFDQYEHWFRSEEVQGNNPVFEY